MSFLKRCTDLRYVAEGIGDFWALARHFNSEGWALPPLRVQLEITHRCNLRCSFCYQDLEAKKGENELTSEEWIDVLRSLPKHILVTITGGEVTIKKGFERILEYALARNLVHVNTNGLQLDEPLRRFLVERRLCVMGVSIDGPEAVHDRLRGQVGAFRTTVENLRLLVEEKRRQQRKWPSIDIKTVITRENLLLLPDFFRQMCDEVHPDIVTLSFLKPSPLQMAPPLLPDFDEKAIFAAVDINRSIELTETRKIFNEITAISRETGVLFRVYPRMRNSEHLEVYFSRQSLSERQIPCFVPWSAIQITPQGYVYPCLGVTVGSVREKDIMQIWNDRPMREFRTRLAKHGLFPACNGCCYGRVRDSREKPDFFW